MSAAKKRAVSQCDDHECESDEPAIKVIKFSVQFSGPEEHDTYKKEGFTKDCEDIEMISAGIKMDRTIEATIELAERLWDPRRGQIKKRLGDYHKRKGITHMPKTTAEVCRSIAVLHLKIKTIEWFCKNFMVRLNTVRKW